MSYNITFIKMKKINIYSTIVEEGDKHVWQLFSLRQIVFTFWWNWTQDDNVSKINFVHSNGGNNWQRLSKNKTRI